MISIGLIDYDATVQRKYKAPNYDLGLTYAYLSKDPNVSVRLVSSLTERNLSKYDKLMIFKISPYLKHPSSVIKDYYKYDLEEYGRGFIHREPRPYFKETFYLKPDFTCYNPILSLSFDRPGHFMAWKIDKAPKMRHYQQIRLFEEFEGEWLRRDLSYVDKYLVIHDDTDILFSNPAQRKVVEELIDKKYHLIFVQPLDISLIKDTNIIEQVITRRDYSTLRHSLIISEMNDSAMWFINYYIKHKCKKTDVCVLFDKGKTSNYYLHSMLLLHSLNHQSGYILRLRPYWDKEIMLASLLTHYAYRFLYETPYLMSFYEYVFYLSYIKLGVPEKMIRTNEDLYDYVFQNYGYAEPLKMLEDWAYKNPGSEDYIFIGGTSNYEKQRRKYYDPRRSNYAFNTSISGTGSECSSQ
jgi:hypothetical protein